MKKLFHVLQLGLGNFFKLITKTWGTWNVIGQ